MKKILYLLLFVSSLSIAQRIKTHKPFDNYLNRAYFLLGETNIRFENSFIKPDNNRISKEVYYFTVFGDVINIKVADPSQNLVRSGYIYDASLRAKEDLYKIENLEIQVSKNNKVKKKWTLVKDTERYSESCISFRNAKNSIENGYFPYKDSLVNGDKLVILFRKKGKENFLELNLEKKESARKPLYTLSMSNSFVKGKDFENFIQEAVNKIHKDKILELYDKTDNDLPDDFFSNFIGGTKRHFKNEKFCLIFKKQNRKKRTDDSFEYRITENSKIREWTRSNGVIFIDLKEAGTHYKLEVRYKDNPKYVAVYECSTEPDWYQIVWFKISIGILFLLIFSLSYIFWMKKINERKRLEQKAKLKLLYAQLNPHFVFNALGSIQGLLNDNQIEKANRYLVGFGSLLRNTLTSSENETHSLENEIKGLTNYIELEQLRNPFIYAVKIDEQINVYETQTFPLLMQPLIENAIKHGITNRENAQINITISKKADDLIFELADNGKGFDILAKQKGFGLKLVNDRIMLFNQSSKKRKIDMKIQSNSLGTKIIISYLNWLAND